MLEIEIKARLYDRPGLLQALGAQGFIQTRMLTETDVYYSGIDRDFALTDEALRLRTTEDHADRAVYTAITYKGPKRDAVDTLSKTREEYETGVSDGACMAELLRALGYKPVLTVKKERMYFARANITACVDTVQGLGDYMELEMLCEKDGGEAASLFALLEALGLDRDACTKKSYLEMLLEKVDIFTLA